VAEDCDEVSHVERPRTLEELIPADLRARWCIVTSTPIVYETPVSRPLTLEDKEREIADGNTIEVRFCSGMQDKRIREIMRANKLDTVHKMDANLIVLRRWAVAQGKKIRLVQEK